MTFHNCILALATSFITCGSPNLISSDLISSELTQFTIAETNQNAVGRDV